MASDRSGLTPHRRQHWSVEPVAPPEAPQDDALSPEATRVEAKRLLWRDSAIILIGIVVALLVAQFLPSLAPGLVADETGSAPGAGGSSLLPAASTPPDATFGPVVDPSLWIDATPRPIPAITLPPTGSFEPVETADPTARPTKEPTRTSGPPTPAPTPKPTPQGTPTPTDPPATDPPATDPPPTEGPSEQP
jgi:hypothetical protein